MPGHLTEHVVAFVRQLREADVRVTPHRTALFLEALLHVGIGDRLAVRDAARTTLAASRDDVTLVDETFERFWHGDRPVSRDAGPAPTDAIRSRARALPAEVAIARRLGRHDEGPPEPVSDRTGTWSASETLRHKRFDRLTTNEAAEVERLIARMRLPPPQRLTRRYRPAAHGRVLDWRGMVRAAVRHDAELVERRWRTRQRKPRPLVVFADVSGSMERYSRLLITFLHALVQRSRRTPRRWAVDVFVFGTRLTRITEPLQARRAEVAIEAVSRQVLDWSGGTRIGETLHAFNREWSRRALGRGAVVAVISDGWDQGQPDLVSRELARLRRSARRLYWLNPLASTPGYAPRTAGLVAAQPYIDALLPAGSLAHLERAMLTIGATD